MDGPRYFFLRRPARRWCAGIGRCRAVRQRPHDVPGSGARCIGDGDDPGVRSVHRHEDRSSSLQVVGEERLLQDVGRIRDVEVLNDGDLLILIDADPGQVLRVSIGG